MTSSDHYCIRSNNIPTVDGHQVRSELTVVGVASKDTGDIICQAKYDESEDASTTTQSTTLTVISKCNKSFIVLSLYTLSTNTLCVEYLYK